MAAAHQALTQSLADDLLAQMRAASPTFFEQLVVDLMIAIGYGGAQGSRPSAGLTPHTARRSTSSSEPLPASAPARVYSSPLRTFPAAPATRQ
ncbi:protein of unknown function [Pseudomonas mediterranea]